MREYDRYENDRRSRYRDERDHRDDRRYEKKDHKDSYSSRSRREIYDRDEDYDRGSRRKYNDDRAKSEAHKEPQDTHRQEEQASAQRSKPRHPGRKKLKVNENLQMFPFIDPEKAAILAGNTLLPYAISIKNRVYIGNMGPEIALEDIRSALTPFGPVVNIGMGRAPDVRETADGISKGFCFVDFVDSQSAEKLLSLDPPVIRIFGRLLRVVETRFHLDNIEKERFMSVENANLLVQAGIIEKIEIPSENATDSTVGTS